jgi:hypothetical protein
LLFLLVFLNIFLGETVQGCHYNIANVKYGEVWLVVSNGDHIAHSVADKSTVYIYLTKVFIISIILRGGMVIALVFFCQVLLG